MSRCLAVLALLFVACAPPGVTAEQRAPAPTRGVTKARVRELRGHEAATRAAYDPALAPPWIDVSGADPYRIAPSGSGFVGVLRGSRALVRLDSELREVARLPLAEAPTALCVADRGDVWLGSRYAGALLRVSADFQRMTSLPGPGGGVADLACGAEGVVHVLPADGSSLLTLDREGHILDRRPSLDGGLRLLRRGAYLLESSLFERTLRVWQLSRRGVPERELGRVAHDGTLWAFDAQVRAGELVIAVSGVQNEALVRVHGEFENIDSFVWLYSLTGGELRELASLNVSEHGVVVPKAVGLEVVGESLVLRALASGSGRLLRARFEPGGVAPRVETSPALPGASDAVFGSDGAVSYASPLFDAWVRLDAAGAHPRRVDPERRPDGDVRLGEALFFTELIAPDNVSSGAHSRFSCETCHFEGGVDGRKHYTGRGDVHVITKPLFGLANNRPHFSRAQDPDLSSVSHNEFRVAGAGSGTDPWFTLESARLPWLRELGVERAALSPLELRAALVDFLYAFSHAPNPAVAGRARFSALEQRGAQAFAEHCQGCHAPRLSADEPQSAQPFEAWERLVFRRNAPLVWARGDYEQTGVVPYVHERGTRVTSLRRLALKPRYFTNGAAPTLEAVLDGFRDTRSGALHDAGRENARLPPLSVETRRALLAFLRLL